MQISAPASGKPEQYAGRLFAPVRSKVDTRWDLLIEWQSSSSFTVYFDTQVAWGGAAVAVEFSKVVEVVEGLVGVVTV